MSKKVKSMKQKRAVCINDISCLGKCSLTVALPIISALGVETVVLPTAVLSTHTAFEGFTFHDLTDEVEPIRNHWAQRGETFDTIYSGYLGSLKQISLGVPVSLQFTMTSVGSMCLQSVVNSFGTPVIAGFTAAGRVEGITNIPMSGLGVATQTFVGQNYGAKNYRRITDTVKKIFILDICISFFMSTALYVMGEPVVSLFMDEFDPAIMEAAKRYILAIAQCYSLVAVLFVMRNTLQGLGFTFANTVAGVGEFFGRLSVAFILTPALGFSAVCYAGPAAWLLADIPLIIIYLHKHRQFRKLISESTDQKAFSD